VERIVEGFGLSRRGRDSCEGALVWVKEVGWCVHVDARGDPDGWLIPIATAIVVLLATLLPDTLSDLKVRLPPSRSSPRRRSCTRHRTTHPPPLSLNLKPEELNALPAAPRARDLLFCRVVDSHGLEMVLTAQRCGAQVPKRQVAGEVSGVLCMQLFFAATGASGRCCVRRSLLCHRV
jgi:hypothetical protein